MNSSNLLQHRFYNKSRSAQRKYLWVMPLFLFMTIGTIGLVAFYSGLYFMALLIPFFILFMAPFIDTPMGKNNGSLTYHSPLFITQKTKHGLILHGGTLFDYVYVIDTHYSGRQRRKLILLGYLQGLLSLIDQYENENKSIRLKGTSYIVNERTALKMGFKPVATDWLQKIILIINYFTLTASYSFAHAKLSFPNLAEVKTYQADLKEVAKEKTFIKNLVKFLSDGMGES